METIVELEPTKSFSERVKDIHKNLARPKQILIEKIVDKFNDKQINLSKHQQDEYDKVARDVTNMNKKELNHMRVEVFNEIEEINKKDDISKFSDESHNTLTLNMKLLQDINRELRTRFVSKTVNVILYSFLASLPIGTLVATLSIIAGVDHEKIKKWIDDMLSKTNNKLTSIEALYNKYGKVFFN